MKNITVIGAGTMGNGIAHVFAQNNFNVNLVDISQEALDKPLQRSAKTWIEWLLRREFQRRIKRIH